MTCGSHPSVSHVPFLFLLSISLVQTKERTIGVADGKVAEPTDGGEGAVTTNVPDTADVELVPDASSTLPRLSLALDQFIGRQATGTRPAVGAQRGGW
jgi:hypothetical protein